MAGQRYATRVGEVAPPTTRRIARHAALDVLAAGARLTARHRHALSRARVQHLYFHHVFEDEERGFQALLADLTQDHRFLPYSKSLERIWSGQLDAPYLAVSFDDGLKSCVTAGRILADRGISACFFVVVSMVGERNFGKVAKFCRDRLAMRPVELLDWDDLEQLLAWGHEIGSHTMTHARLVDLDPPALHDELERSREILCRRLGPVRHFAWPFASLDAAPPDIVSRALACGYESCASAVRGAHTRAASREELCLRRDHVMAKWPPRHLRYLLARNSLVSSPQTNLLPGTTP